MRIKAKQILYVGAFIVLTLIGYIFLPKDEVVINTNAFVDDSFQDISGNIINKEMIYVHIEGAVNFPGIKDVPKNTRLFELIEIAGGELDDADLSKLNLASILKDEQKVYVPFKISNETVGLDKDEPVKIYNEIDSYNKDVNINTASSEDLQTLEGIGPAMADKIINYRELNGYFSSIEDIKNVSGIGEAKFNKIKDNITI